MNALRIAELRSLQPPESSDAEQRRADRANDYANACTDIDLPDALVSALDATSPGWLHRAQDWLASQEMGRLELADEERRMDHEAEKAEDRRYGGSW